MVPRSPRGDTAIISPTCRVPYAENCMVFDLQEPFTSGLPSATLGVTSQAQSESMSFTYFVCVVEAQTAPLGVPFAIAVVAFGILRGRKHLRQQPLLAFFFAAHLVALVLFAMWGIYWGGLPEFSKVGIIQ